MEENTTAGSSNQVDDRGTSAEEGRMMLRRLRSEGFEGDDEKFAIALGRPVEEVRAWMLNDETVDDDVIMKAREIAKERGLSIE